MNTAICPWCYSLVEYENLLEDELVQFRTVVKNNGLRKKKFMAHDGNFTKQVNAIRYSIHEYNRFMSTVDVLISNTLLQKYKIRNDQYSLAVNNYIAYDRLNHYSLIEDSSDQAEKRYETNATAIAPHIYTITHNNGTQPIIYQRLSTLLYRVFGETLDKGGRFYGADYQQLPNSKTWPLRNSIIINGNSVVERDYSGLHFRMLYNFESIDMLDDPYDIGVDEELRPIVKVMANIILNCNCKNGVRFTTLRAILSDSKLKRLFYNFPQLSLDDIHNKLIEKHQAIAKYFHTSIGVQLQKEDSELAIQILNHFTRKRIPCLCIHDSFIVEKQHQVELVYVMGEVYRRRFNYSCPIK